MAGYTHVDELIDYSDKIINVLGTSQVVVGLLVNNPTVDMTSDEAYNVFDRNLFDYNYVDDTIQENTALIMVETDIPRVANETVKDMEVYVHVVVSKDYMKLKPSVFRGVKGNRRDNLVRQIDLLLNKQRGFGIGKLNLKSVRTAKVPTKFTSKLLTYEVVNFATNREKLPNGT